MSCLDLDNYKGTIPLELYGSHDDDKARWLDIALVPCNETDPKCDVRKHRDNKTDKMDLNAIWDEIG